MQRLTTFGLLALVLCTVGSHSVLAYSVKRGMKEIGLRIAFGANRRDVLQFVVAQGKPTAIRYRHWSRRGLLGSAVW
jgi:hypothetical protein